MDKRVIIFPRLTRVKEIKLKLPNRFYELEFLHKEPIPKIRICTGYLDENFNNRYHDNGRHRVFEFLWWPSDARNKTDEQLLDECVTFAKNKYLKAFEVGYLYKKEHQIYPLSQIDFSVVVFKSVYKYMAFTEDIHPKSLVCYLEAHDIEEAKDIFLSLYPALNKDKVKIMLYNRGDKVYNIPKRLSKNRPRKIKSYNYMDIWSSSGYPSLI